MPMTFEEKVKGKQKGRAGNEKGFKNKP